MKGKWKNLRDNFRKEVKKIPKSRSGDSSEEAPVYSGSWVHFHAMLFLKAVFTPRDTQGNIESQNSQLYSEEATQSQIDQVIQSDEDQQPQTQLETELNELETVLPDKDGPVTPIQAKKKRKVTQNPNTTFEREMLELEQRKVELLCKNDNDDEDMNFFKSLLPHVKLLPSINKLAFRSAVQNLLLNEIFKVQNQEAWSQQEQPRSISCVSTPYPSPAGSYMTSASDTSHHTNQQPSYNPNLLNL